MPHFPKWRVHAGVVGHLKLLITEGVHQFKGPLAGRLQLGQQFCFLRLFALRHVGSVDYPFLAFSITESLVQGTLSTLALITLHHPQTSRIIGTATAVTRIDSGKPKRQ